MAKILKAACGSYISVADCFGDEREEDWRSLLLGQGIVLLCESERNFPGRKFVQFYHWWEGFGTLPSIKTGAGIYTENSETEFTINTKNSIYKFEWNDNLSEYEKYYMYQRINLELKKYGLSI